MAGSNYYEWLELPIEPFQNDPAELLKTAEKKFIAWNSHKKSDIQNRTKLHEQKIRAAINDPAEWEKIYKEYKAGVDANIEKDLIFFVTNNKVKLSDAEEIANSNKVDTEYVKRICASLKYIVDDGGNPPPQQKKKPKFTVDDLAPASPRPFYDLDSIQNIIIEMGYSSLMELLADPNIIGLKITENTPEQKIVEALDKMKAKWKDIPQSGAKGTQKTHLEKIHAGFTKSFKDNFPFSEYIKLLKYLKAKALLNSMPKSLKELSEDAFNHMVTQLFEFTEDQDKAKDILISYCDSKKIAYPIERPKVAMCPFCSHSFEREDPIQKNCPVCGQLLTVKCPKCGKLKHIIDEPECDGINIGAYPILLESLASVEKYLDSLSLEAAKYKLDDINAKWPSFPGSENAFARLSKLGSDYGADIKKLSEYRISKQLYAAKAIIDKINVSFPGFKDGYGDIYSEIKYVEAEFERAKKEPDNDTRLNLLMSLSETVSDFSRLNAELQKYPIQAVTSFTASPDSSRGVISLNWKSDNNSAVTYVIRRKKDTTIAGITDGEGVGKTQGTSFADENVKEGELYYYAVFAQRGPLTSPVMVLGEPVTVLKKPSITIIPKDGALDLSWTASATKMRVFYSDKEITGYDQGTEIKGLSSTGVLVENLKNNTPYYVAAYKFVSGGSKEYRSTLSVFPPAAPMKKIDPPIITRFIGEREGEYLLKCENISDKEPVFYYSEAMAGIPSNDTISIGDIERKAKKLSCVKLPDGRYKVDMNGMKKMIVYPAFQISGSLMVGSFITLTYIKRINIRSNVSGSALCMFIDNWPENAERLLICYSFEGFPEDSGDCEAAKRIIVSKADFMKNKSLEIRPIQQKHYYISLFARSGRDDILIGNHEENLEKPKEIRYYLRKSGMSSIILYIKNSDKYRPALTFAASRRCVPLSKSEAEISFEIIERFDAPEIELVTISRKALPKICYGRIFCDKPGYQLLMENALNDKAGSQVTMGGR